MMENLQQDYVFALDIGTRSVIGILGVKEDEQFRVLDCEVMEHPQRAMVDGQIEDIEQVAKITEKVRKTLEERQNCTLNEVCIAAAGRALTTRKAEFSMTLNPFESITKEQVYELEMGAVENAYAAVEESIKHNPAHVGSGNQFYCVGYSVMHYYLDDYPLMSLSGHKGSLAKVEVIATFLPNAVVESLYETMNLNNMQIRNLTLEPIAAMNAVIPPELRLMNLALVDIGAGTSDIAIVDGGAVAAYTMATVAGDEITESLIQRYLVDFDTAEKMKFQAEAGEAEISYVDVLGFDYTVSREEVLEAIRPAVENLGEVISRQILEANGRTPSAVFLVGGGSKVPMLKDFVATKLGLDDRKVAIGGIRAQRNLVLDGVELVGPEYATPVGIALTAVSAGNHEGFHVFVNDVKTRVFRSGLITVMDVLLTAGYKYNQLLGRLGKSLQYRLNGENIVVRGGYPEPATLLVNGEPAGISTALEFGDRITVVPGQSGEDVHLTLQDIVPNLGNLEVTANGEKYTLSVMATVNRQIVHPTQEIEDRDEIQVYASNTVHNLCQKMELDEENKIFLVNGVRSELETQLADGDIIFIREKTEYDLLAEMEELKKTEELLEEAEEIREIEEIQEAEEIQEVKFEEPEETVVEITEEMGQTEAAVELETKKETEVLRKEESVAEEIQVVPPRAVMSVYINQQKVDLLPKPDGQRYQFWDMLNYVDIDPSKPQGQLVLRLNDKEASYMAEIKAGDKIEIGWER